VIASFSPDGRKARLSTQSDGLRIADLDEQGGLVDDRPVPEGYERGPGMWSPDSRWIIDTGRFSGDDSVGVDVEYVALDTETDAVVVVTDPDGEPAPWFGTTIWIDDTRILARSRPQDPVFIFDVSTRESRWVEIEVDRQARFIAYLDDWIYLSRSDDLTNLWLITFDEPVSE
jgi:hypothetical protein